MTTWSLKRVPLNLSLTFGWNFVSWILIFVFWVAAVLNQKVVKQLVSLIRRIGEVVNIFLTFTFIISPDFLTVVWLPAKHLYMNDCCIFNLSVGKTNKSYGIVAPFCFPFCHMLFFVICSGKHKKWISFFYQNKLK